MSCAIIVLNYNDAEVTLRYLDTIKDYRFCDHIIVVDNASTDGSVDILRPYCLNNGLDFIASKENKGYSRGNNIGAFYAINHYDPDYLIISNPDIICSEDSIKTILDSFSINEDVAVVTGLIHVFNEAHNAVPYKYFAYKVPTLRDYMLNCLLVSTKFRKDIMHKSMYYDYNDVIRRGSINVGAVSGCFFAIKASSFREIGGFDEDVFLYNEEAILGKKLQEKDLKLMVINAPIIHDEKQDKHKGLKKRYITHTRIQKSALIYLKKYLGAGNLECALFVVLNSFGFAERYLLSLIRR